jgi:hypothetical protein
MAPPFLEGTDVARTFGGLRVLHMLTLGLVLIVVALGLPGGLAGLARRRPPACDSPRATL